MSLKSLHLVFARVIFALIIVITVAIDINAQDFASIELLQSFNVSANTGEKPQSKVWTYDGYWWAVMPGTSGTMLWKLEGTSWASVMSLSTYTDIHADVKVQNNVAHILLFRGRNSQLISLEYISSTQSYQLWSDRPSIVDMTLDTGVETATIDIDSYGRMWLASDAVTDVNIRWSDPPYSSWSSAINLANNINSDDISVIAAFNGNIGVFWSNQNTQRFGFKYHIDNANVGSWSTDEVPASQSALNVGAGMADDHMNLAIASDGTIYAAVKTSYDTPGYPKIALLVRRPNGTWDNLYGVDDSGTRGIALLNEYKRTITVVYTASEGLNNIVYRQSYLSPISFGIRRTLISGSINDATSIKGNYSDKVAILAGDGSIVASVMAYSGLGFRDSLVGYWAMNEGSGTMLIDSSSVHNDGTIEGNPNWRTGIHDLALELNGDNQFAGIPDNPSLHLGNMFTIAAWIKPGVYSQQPLICKTNGNNGFELCLEGTSPHKILLKLNGTDIINSTSSYPIDGEWVHVAATWDGSTIRMYINGEEESSLQYTIPPVLNSVNLEIGRNQANGEYYQGIIDEVYLYRRALGSSEIQTLSTRPPIQYSISATAGSNGIINPIGLIRVLEGGSQTFSISANIGYHIEDILIDGISIGPSSSYTFENINSDHTIYASFVQNSALMAARWTMDEGIGSTLVDSSGNNNGATIIGSSSWTLGRHGLALQLSGSQYAMVANNATLEVSNNLTFTAWIKPTASSNQSIVKKAISGSVTVDGYELSLGAAGSSADRRAFVRFNQASSGDSYRVTANSLYPIDGNTWMHIAATYDGTLIKLYINGVLENSLPATIIVNANSLALGIGAQSDGTMRFYGALDDIRIYNYALTASEINAISGINHSPNLPTLVYPPDQSAEISGTPLLRAIVSDPDSDLTTAVFWGKEAQSAYQLIGQVSNISSGNEVSLVWNDLRPGTHYFWYVISSDDSSSTTGPIWSFSTADVFHIISATTGQNGAIEPSGEIQIPHNGNQTFAIIADNGYHIRNLLVDSIFVGPLSFYTFNNVVTSHSIDASFEINSYNITASAGPNGQIAPSGSIDMLYGQDTTFTFVPDLNYHLSDIIVDGLSIGPASSYTFNDISANHTIHAVFSLTTFIISASAGPNGAIMPSGEVIVGMGEDASFSIDASQQYHIVDVLVDGVSNGPISQFTFSDIAANHSIDAIFGVNEYVILASAGDHGSITPSGAVNVDAGTDHEFTIVPDSGYHINEVFIDSLSVGRIPSYTFYSVVDNHQIYATFAIDTFTISAFASTGGIVNPNGYITVSFGQNQSFEILADSGYFTSDVIIDSVHIGTLLLYTFNNIAQDHTINAVFSEAISPVILSVPPDSSRVGSLYNYLPDVMGLPRPIFRLLSNPPNMSIDTTTGNINWIPIEPGNWHVDLMAYNFVGTDTQSFEITVIDGCNYHTGDINGNGVLNGLDVIYGVNYFKGGSVPPHACSCNRSIWFVSGDVNASCTFNGIDITFIVLFLKGGANPVPCWACPPPEK